MQGQFVLSPPHVMPVQTGISQPDRAIFCGRPQLSPKAKFILSARSSGQSKGWGDVIGPASYRPSNSNIVSRKAGP